MLIIIPFIKVWNNHEASFTYPPLPPKKNYHSWLVLVKGKAKIFFKSKSTIIPRSENKFKNSINFWPTILLTSQVWRFTLCLSVTLSSTSTRSVSSVVLIFPCLALDNRVGVVFFQFPSPVQSRTLLSLQLIQKDKSAETSKQKAQ